ncbi:MAG TPA: hypothetical protein VE994_07735 [Terriglobales bacterium]|nr:hypothetical protein [Terriglobales bacterium]
MTGRMKLALAMSVLLLSSAAALADGDDYRRGDYDRGNIDGRSYAFDHEAREQNRFYQQGLRDGREDREHGRTWRIRDRHWDDRGDRDAYIDGYRAGFGAPGYGMRDPDDGYRRNYMRQAYNFGYEDGVRIGAQDRDGGHSFRPTHGDRWDDADRGYNSSFGSKQAYKDAYRSGYREGYERGYNRRW